MLVPKIRTLASERGYTLASLEKELKFSNGSIRKWEVSTPACDKVLLVANFLNVSVDYLLKDEMCATNETGGEENENEKRLIRYYRHLDEISKDVMLGFAARLFKEKDVRDN